MDPVVVVSDVHGCFAELIELEQLVYERTGPSAYLVFVGDLVDRGPASARVVGHVRHLVRAGRAACVMGNHDDMFLRNVFANQPDWCRNAGVPGDVISAGTIPDPVRPAFFRNWFIQGGEETLASYGIHSHDRTPWDVDPDDVAFLASLPLIWENERVVVTHALADEKLLTATRSAESQWDVDEAAREMVLWNRGEPAARADPVRTHVSGHTPRNTPLVRREQGAIQIDTGCVYGNALTAYDPQRDQFMQVRSRRPSF